MGGHVLGLGGGDGAGDVAEAEPDIDDFFRITSCSSSFGDGAKDECVCGICDDGMGVSKARATFIVLIHLYIFVHNIHVTLLIFSYRFLVCISLS